MRTISEEPVKTPARPVDLETYSTQLKDGRTVTIREMTGKDLVYLEEELSDMGDIRRNFNILTRLNVGGTELTYEEIESLGVRDIKKIMELVAKANGDDTDSKN